MVDGIKQYFLNLITPESGNNRLEYTVTEKGSPDKSRLDSSSQSHTSSDGIWESLGQTQTEMKLRNRLSRWTFSSRNNSEIAGGAASRRFHSRHSAEILSRSSSCLTHPAASESIELSCRPACEKDLVREVYGHHFSPIPLDADTFCDFCNKPIYGLGYGPVCQRCAGKYFFDDCVAILISTFLHT